jgi:hypothetical protein
MPRPVRRRSGTKLRTAFDYETGRKIIEIVDARGRMVGVIRPWEGDDTAVVIDSFHVRDVINGNDRVTQVPRMMVRFT